MDLRCNTHEVNGQHRWQRALRGSTSHAVLMLSAAALLAVSASADVDSGTTVKISTLSGSGTTLAGGTLQIDESKTYSRDFTLKASTASVIDTFGQTSTLSGKFTGSGDITFSNSASGGVLTLTGSSNDYTGATTIASGTTLALDDLGTIATSSKVTVNGIFDISARDTGTSIISLAGNGNVKLGSLALVVSSASDTFDGVVSGTGSLSLTAGTETLTAAQTYTGATIVNGGTLKLTGNGSVASSASVVVYGTLDASAANSATLTSLSGSGALLLGSNKLILTNSSGSYSGSITGTGGIELQGGTQWLGGTNTITGGVTIASGATLQVGSSTVAFDTVNSGTFSYYNSSALEMTGVVSGSGAVTKLGYGVATIESVQTYTGATTISGGTLKLYGTGSIAASSGVQVDSVLDLTEADGATIKSLSGYGTVRLGEKSLAISAATGGEFSGSITGTGNLTISSGTQLLSGTSTYTGTTTVGSSATLTMLVGASLKSAVTVNGGGNLKLATGLTTTGSVTVGGLGGAGTVELGANTLILTAPAGIDFSGDIKGTGGIWIGGGNQILSGVSEYTGTTNINAGTLTLTGALANTSKLVVDGTFDASGAQGATLSYAALSGSGTVKVGSHTLELLQATGNFSGTIQGTNGLLVSGGTAILSGTNSYGGGTAIASGATLQLGNGSTTGSITGNVANNGTLKFYRVNSYFFDGTVSGSGGLEQAGIGTTVLTADNTYSGVTRITYGTLQIGDGGTTGSIDNTSGIVDNGTLAFKRQGDITIDTLISGTGSVSILTGTVSFTAASTYEGVTTIASGATLKLGNTASIYSSDYVAINGTLDLTGLASGTSLKSLSGADTGAVNLGTKSLTLTGANTTFAGTISGSGDLTMTSGTQVLSGNSAAFTGATHVTGGVLSVTGSLAGSAITVDGTGTLSGTGTVKSITVGSGGTVAAGTNGAGTLSANGAVSFASGSSYTVNMSSTGFSALSTTGTASLAGSLKVASLDGTYYLGKPMTVLTASGGLTGTFSTSTIDLFTGSNGARYTSKVNYSASAVTLEVDLAKLSNALSTDATTNQFAVAGGIDKAIAAGETPSLTIEALGNATSDQLGTATSQLAGEIGADAALVTRSLFNPFMDALSARTSMIRPIGKNAPQPVEAWVTAYSGVDAVQGNLDTGAHKYRSTQTGVVAGLQWSPSAKTVFGGALALGTSDFRVAESLGKGTATSLQAGAYGYMQMSRHFYNAFSLGVAATQIKTTRVLTVTSSASPDTLTSKSTAVTFGGRYEAGIQMALFTPYVGVQDHISMLPSYTESGDAGHDAFALKYSSRTANTGRVELGLRQQIDVEVTPRWILTPDFTLHLNNRLAYAYDLSDGASVDAMFDKLKSSDFTVYGAKGGRHGALATVGADVLFDGGFRLTTHFDAAVTQKSQSYTGFVGLGYTW